jgi:predicted outer membrane lipoprotein
MKAFIVGTAVAVVIAIVAALALNSVDMTTAETYTRGDVRL